MPATEPGHGEALAGGAGDAEVAQVGVQVDGVGVAQQHVAGLDVAVHDAGPVGVVERVGHLGAHAGGQRRAASAAGGQQLAEVAAADVLGGDVGAAVLDAVVEDVDDVGRVQPRQHRGLALEAVPELVGVAQRGGDDLEGDPAVERRCRWRRRRRPCRPGRSGRRCGSDRSGRRRAGAGPCRVPSPRERVGLLARMPLPFADVRTPTVLWSSAPAAVSTPWPARWPLDPRRHRGARGPRQPGHRGVAGCHDVDPMDGAAVADLAERAGRRPRGRRAEAPLVAGVADAVSARGIAVFGPSAAAARSRAPRRSPRR